MRPIFVSYRREDSEGEAGRLFDDLVIRFGEDSVFRSRRHQVSAISERLLTAEDDTERLASGRRKGKADFSRLSHVRSGYWKYSYRSQSLNSEAASLAVGNKSLSASFGEDRKHCSQRRLRYPMRE